MQRFAIKKLPLNVSSMVKKVKDPMSVRPELGEFEIQADSIEEARAIAQTRVRPDEPNLICPWREKVNSFIAGTGKNKEFVHPTLLYKYNGKSFSEFIGSCHRDQASSGRFMSKDDAEADYRSHKRLADEKFEAALAHLKAMSDLGVSIDYCMEGDTHGIHEDYMYLETTEGPYNFRFEYSI
jgi:hypothetical protein